MKILDHALNTKYYWAIIKNINLCYLKLSMGKMIKKKSYKTQQIVFIIVTVSLIVHC